MRTGECQCHPTVVVTCHRQVATCHRPSARMVVRLSPFDLPKRMFGYGQDRVPALMTDVRRTGWRENRQHPSLVATSQLQATRRLPTNAPPGVLLPRALCGRVHSGIEGDAPT